MQRQGSDPANMSVSDFLCDFCGRAWDGAFPMVEGHQGSLICGGCLSVAWLEVGVAAARGAPAGGSTCTMCLERRDEPTWSSPTREAHACRRCVRQAAGTLEQDPDWEWSKPDAGSDQRSAISD
jgi:hypothetical protein